MTQPTTRPRIMVCEDEPLIAMHLAALLSQCGCEVIGPFATGREARAALAKQSIDAAILDIELADGASTPLARFIRDSGVPMIVLSGLHTASPPPEFAGVEWLIKPVDEDRLRAFCDAALPCQRSSAPVRTRAPEPVPSPTI